ncbi:MAG: isoaspartyl peptidase/L-asparaginase [Myxococcales bacterium]|nr:isoaspartyl peptidase/L-asparaginase [Myxococcales bacterium]
MARSAAARPSRHRRLSLRRPVIALVVHGGAGALAPDDQARAAAGCAAATAIGFARLRAGASALDAVQAAVRALEDDPVFNAGVGAVLTRAGTVELDAAIMDGATGRVGGVAAVPDLRRPIDLARAVLDDGEHLLLAGPAAWDFARRHGHAPAPAGTMVTPRARARLLGRRGDVAGGTVGAVALDAGGALAAATSTGGISGKRPGRVGDSAIPGCGTWADRGCAASATGAGEAIVRATLTRRLALAIAAGAGPAVAAAELLDELAGQGAGAGVIVVDQRGQVAAVHRTSTMAFAAMRDAGGGVRATAGVSTTAAADLEALLASASSAVT